MKTTRVTSLAYVGLNGPADDWRRFATELLGLADVSAAAATDAHFRMDERSWRIAIHDGEQHGVAYLGFETMSREHLDQVIDQTERHGYSGEWDAERASERRVSALYRLVDPTGIEIELSYGALVAPDPFVSPLGVRFLTEDMGLGHVVMMSRASAADLLEFYCGALGFGLSDVLSMGPMTGYFLHCNRRHHTVAVGGDAPFDGLAHLMVEVESLDDVGLVADRALRSGALFQHIGRHTNDHMVSCYVMTPSGFPLEYGCFGRAVDPDQWASERYSAPSIWGHQQVSAEATPDIAAS